MSELIIYQTDDGLAQVQFRAASGSVWLSQLEMAELFTVTVANANIHIRNILKEGELDAAAVIKEDLTTAADGKRYRTKLYRLDMILAVGFRVRSARGTQFRQWAAAHLADYLVKGFVMDDERLKNPGGWDYFDELLAVAKWVNRKKAWVCGVPVLHQPSAQRGCLHTLHMARPTLEIRRHLQ